MSDAAPASFQLNVTSAALPSSDERWLAQVEGLLDELRECGGDVRKEVTPVAGQKGGIEAIILALGSSGAIAGAVTVIRSWLARSADRSIELEGLVEGKKVKLKLTGRNIDETTLRQALKAALT